MKVLSVVGNRPQFIKSAPLSLALRARRIDEVSVHTGQHYDRELSQIFFDELGLPEPRHRLGAGSATREEMLERMRPGLRRAIEDERPDVVLVYGDTNSTLAGGRAGREAGVAVAHVEAGLRSGDWSMPEEHNRVEVDRLAALLFCPDERSRETLAAEGVPGKAVVVGDVMLDATQLFSPRARARTDLAARLTGASQRYVVLTLHREANVREDRLRRLISEVNSHNHDWIFPAHPRTRDVIEHAAIELAPSVHMVEPVGYLDMLALVSHARAVVTDSGGLQKEAYWLGVPCVTLRRSTEWVDTVRVGANVLVDPEDPTALGPALAKARMPSERPQLYGDGRASERIAEALYTLTRR
ncbi:MAG: UDP-N-acetylglucosamine 2-epimerase (non-hydrolyzing) [Actinomycetota bacterium]|nr:UDP-N-acetylglucosamine 2-epimerase (non-hydrolyzing) [Actinomycetota bacterium]